MKAIGFAFGLLALPAVAKEPIKWIESLSGGSKIEIPEFFEDGDGWLLGGFAENYGSVFDPASYPDAELRQYRALDKKKTPFEYLKQAIVGDGSIATYKIDRPSLAVISGTSPDGEFIFYGMCQKHRTVTCFDMHWNKKDQAMFQPIAERIARSSAKIGDWRASANSIEALASLASPAAGSDTRQAIFFHQPAGDQIPDPLLLRITQALRRAFVDRITGRDVRVTLIARLA